MFSKLNFIVPLSSNDKVLKIRNTSGLVVHIIRDPTCTVKQEGINVTVKQQSESQTIVLNFPSILDASAAHIILRDNLRILANNLGLVPSPGPIPPQFVSIELLPYDNCDPQRHAVLLTDIWTESNLIPYTAPVTTSGVVEIVVDLPLIWDTGSIRFSSPNFTDIIPHYFGDGSYAFVLKTYNNVIIPQGWQDWIVDVDCGRIYFRSGFVSTGPIIVDATRPPKISFYKYTGTKGVFAPGGGLNLQIGFYPPTTLVGIDTNFTVPVAIQNIIGFYINGQFIDNNINTQYVLTPSVTAPTTITWKGTADFILENDDVVTLIYN